MSVFQHHTRQEDPKPLSFQKRNVVILIRAARVLQTRLCLLCGSLPSPSLCFWITRVTCRDSELLLSLWAESHCPEPVLTRPPELLAADVGQRRVNGRLLGDLKLGALHRSRTLLS